jgi:hypothetical protein
MQQRKKPSRRRFLFRVALLVAGIAGIAAGVMAFRNQRNARLVLRAREAAEPSESRKRIEDLFAARRDALSEGVIDLSADDGTSAGSLRILNRLLADDELLESETHLRPRSAGGGRAVMSAHVWLASPEAAPLRDRLFHLAGHPKETIRIPAIACLGAMAVKVPEVLAEEPLFPYRREHVRAFLRLAAGDPLDPLAPARPFLREVLAAPGALRAWEKGSLADRKVVIDLALRGLLATGEPIDGDLADGVIDATRNASDFPAPTQVLIARILALTDHPEAWRRLVVLARADHPLDVRLEAIASLKIAGPAESIEGLQEAAGSDRETSAQAQEAIEHIAGEPPSSRQGWRPDPDRLAALRRRVRTGTDAARAVSALLHHRFHPGPSRKDGEIERLVVAAFGSQFIEVRIEAARTAGRTGAVSALGGAGRPQPGAPPALIDLLADPDFRVASAAAEALFELTAAWPAEDGHGTDAPGSLPPELAADPARLSRWKAEWAAWKDRKIGAQRSAWLVEGLESRDPSRAIRAARSLSGLASRGGLDGAAYAALRDRLLAAFPAVPAAAKVDLLAVLGGREGAELLGDLLGKTGGDAIDAWEIFRAIHAGAPRGSPAPAPAAIVDVLLGILGIPQGGPMGATLVRYLDARFPPDLVDERLLAAIRAREGPRDRARAEGAARWFPRSPDRQKALILVDLLSDPLGQVRFWSGRHLAELAGTDGGYDPEAPEPRRSEAIARWRTWAEGWGGAKKN